MKNLKKTAFIFLFTAILITVCSCKSKKLPVVPVTITRADGSSIIVQAEFARTEEQRNHGFMERKNIPDGTGMLFIFDKEQTLSFWMKNTPHPLSIAYIDARGKIRNIYDMTPYSLSPIKSTISCRYALEVPQGWYSDNNVQVGDIVTW